MIRAWCWYIIWCLLLIIGTTFVCFYYTNSTNSHHVQATESSTSPINYYPIIRYNQASIYGKKTTELPFGTAITEKFHQLLPRAAYFDMRDWGEHKNATVVLVHLTRTANLKVVACKINNYLTKAVEVKQLKLNPWLSKKFGDCTHENALVVCYDTPGLNDSKVFIVYELENASQFVSVESEHRLLVPKVRKSSNSTVMVCTTVFNTPQHFGAWIRYQKTLGVDMIHINAQESFLSSSAYDDSFFLESLHSGFIQLQVWKEHLPPGALFYHSQALLYQDCLYRYLGVYDYCMCADTDDFLVSRDKNDPGIHRLVQKIFNSNPKQQINSVSLQWIRYLEPAKGFDPSEKEIKDGNLTQYVNTLQGEDEGKYRTKSIYRLSAIAELGIHESSLFLETGKQWINRVSETVGYVAHIRKHPRAEDKVLHSCTDV